MRDEDVNFIKRKLSSLDKQQKTLLDLQNKLLEKENEIFELERRIYDVEEKNYKLHKKFNKNSFEKFIHAKRDVLGKINYKDFVKAIIGAFFGVMGHFAFAKGVDIAQGHSYLRSTLLLLTSFIILILFIYFSGYRQVKTYYFLKFFPLRATAIYVSAIFTVVFVLLLYGIVDFSTPFKEVYNVVAAISILAVLGAGTSDLIGGK